MIYFNNNIGLKTRNDDSVLVNNELHLNSRSYLENNFFNAGVFDGVGGNKAGDVASKFIATNLITYKQSGNLESFLTNLVSLNNNLIKLGNENINYKGMATTIAYIENIGSEIVVCNVGDSKVYRFRENILWQISFDDKLSSNVESHTITKCFGIPLNENDFHINFCDFTSKDIFIVCSDGVSDIISIEEMEEILSVNKSIKEIVDVLENIFNEREMFDNYSIVIAWGEEWNYE